MTPLEWLGAIVGILVGLGIFLFGAAYLTAVLVEKFDRIVDNAASVRIRKRAQQMKNQQYWWPNSEHAAIWVACAEHMADGGYPDVQVVRDQTYRLALSRILADRSK